MANFDRIQAATEKHAAARDSTVVQLVKLLLQLWAGFNRWDDADIVAGYAARSATLVTTATARTRLLNRSYVLSVMNELGTPVQKLPAITNSYPRANVGPSEVYQRPAEQFIWSRRSGAPTEESRAAFEQRITDLAEMDIIAADRDEAATTYESLRNVSGYRRVIHPELSRSGTCGLCAVASTQVYNFGDLMPIHQGCNCDTLPITGTDDPGLRLNNDDLKTIYAAAGSTAAAELANTRVTVDEHGELGPVLVKEGDNFRTAKEAGRPPYLKPDPAAIRRDKAAERAGLAGSIKSAQARYDSMSDAEKYIDGTRNTTPEAVQLFRSIKFMNEYAASIDAFLQRLPA